MEYPIIRISAGCAPRPKRADAPAALCAAENPGRGRSPEREGDMACSKRLPAFRPGAATSREDVIETQNHGRHHCHHEELHRSGPSRRFCQSFLACTSPVMPMNISTNVALPVHRRISHLHFFAPHFFATTQPALVSTRSVFFWAKKWRAKKYRQGLAANPDYRPVLPRHISILTDWQEKTEHEEFSMGRNAERDHAPELTDFRESRRAQCAGATRTRRGPMP